jgi:hypothetical protein
MILFILSAILAVAPGENILDKATSHYSNASGIQWSIKSASYSPIFDETENADVEFDFNSPDTFYYKSGDEETIGIADTVWTISKKHHQIQKRLSGDYPMPTDYFLNWKARYELIADSSRKDEHEFVLKAHEGITPPQIILIIDRNNHLKSLSYQDASGNNITLTVLREKLARTKKINLFYRNIPEGYKLIDLTE